ncbi:MAG: zf-TFIIB domain-containing protein [Pseudomonadota bacterium]
MKCPACPDTTLTMADRQGIEIDYCPQCRGVWLDRGELDKLMERAVASVPAQPVQAMPAPRRDFSDSDYKHSNGYGTRRKKSWLNEIFD